MNILLVYPKCPDTFWSFRYALWFIGRKAAFPPLGLMTIAAMLPKEWKIRLVDLNVRDLENKDIEWAEMVFISAMLVQKDSAQKIITRRKKAGKTVVAGGPAFSAQPELFERVDHFVLNEAEITLPIFLQDLKNGEVKRMYTSSEKPSLTQTPLPLWSLINFKDYATMSVQYSRGCPFNCDFCDIIVMNGRTPRVKKPEQMIEEFQLLYNKGWRGSVFIVDDNFIGNKPQVKIMLKQLIDWQKKHKYPFQFITEASINLASSKDLMELMSKANFFKVFLGIETTHLDSLEGCGKVQNTKVDLSEAVRIIQGYGMQVMGGFIVGFDNDPVTVFESQIKFIRETGIVTAMVGLLTALPKTPLWHQLKEENRLLGLTTGENTDGSLNFIPIMDKKVLLEGYKYILSQIYSSGAYYKRICIFLKNYKPTVKGNKISKEDVLALFRSIWKIGFLSKSRFLYWRLVLKTLLTKTKTFPLVIGLIIQGIHLQKITKKVIR